MAGPAQIDLALQPKQEQLHELMEATGRKAATTLGWGGARGAAKSGGLRRICLARRWLHPGTPAVIVRRVWEDLRTNHVDPFFEEYPALERFYNASDHEINLPNGSVIAFRYAERLATVRRKFMGPQYYDIFIDQAEQFSEEELLTIKSANRWPGTAPGECKTAMFFNPGGAGTEYLRRVFYLKQYKEKERPGDFDFIQAYGWDNYEWFRQSGVDLTVGQFYALKSEKRFELFIHETDYGRKLNELPPTLRAGHLLGSFTSFAGQYYTAVWDEDKIIETQDRIETLMQAWWTRWLATDWGFAHYAASLWAATGKLSPEAFEAFFGIRTEWPIDIVILYRENVVSETAERDLAQMIVDKTPAEEKKVMRHHFFSPEAMGGRNSRADLMSPVLKLGGTPTLEHADDDRVDGWRLVFNLFKQTCSLLSVGKDSQGRVVNKKAYITKAMAQAGPMILIGANCVDVIAAVPLAMRAEKNSDDVEKTSQRADDVLDCLRYLLKSFLQPKKQAPKEVRLAQVIETHTDPTERAMAVRRFEAAEKPKRRRTRWGIR